MSTIEIQTDQPHTTVLNQTRFWCIDPDCDGEHHVYCSCDRQHAA